MSSKEAKNEEAKQVPAIDRVASTFTSTEKAFVDLEGKFIAARRDIREQAETYARAQEERQRAAAQWDYEEAQRRREVKDRQEAEDRERDRKHAEREAALQVRERVFIETATELFGVTGNPFDPKQAKVSLDKKIEAAEAKGKSIAKAEAEKDYATKKAIDDATASTALALLKSDNDRLKSDNAKLENENKRLSEINTNLATRSGDLALGAFQAAGGLQSKANDSLQMAAQGPRVPGR